MKPKQKKPELEARNVQHTCYSRSDLHKEDNVQMLEVSDCSRKKKEKKKTALFFFFIASDWSLLAFEIPECVLP